MAKDIKIKQNKIENRNIKQKAEREKESHLGLPGGPSGRPSPPPPPLSSSSSARRTSRGEAWRASTPATSCFALEASPFEPIHAWRRHVAAPHRSHSPSPSPSSPALSPSHPRTTAATDADCRSHRAPLASPTPPRAPQVLPRPPRRLTRPEEPRNAAPDVSPSPAAEDLLRRIRPLRRAPELADPPCTIPVSPCSVSP